jgi:hypothetical protein
MSGWSGVSHSDDVYRVRPAVGPAVALLVPVTGDVTVRLLGVELAPGSRWWPERWVDNFAGQGVMWCGERRRIWELPANGSAWMLAARLGSPDLAERIGLNGDLLVAGLTPDGLPCDVPDLVLDAARRAGLLASSAPSRARAGSAVAAGLRVGTA